jgi:hypothetical protein
LLCWLLHANTSITENTITVILIVFIGTIV